MRGKCESKTSYDPQMIEMIKKNVFSRIDAECFLAGADLHSPKVQNLYYKPILTYIYYVLQFISLKQ